MRPVLGIVDEPDVHATFPHLHETLLRADPSVIGQEDTIEQKLINAWQNNPEVTVHPVEPHKQGSGLSAVPFVLLQSGAAMHKQNCCTNHKVFLMYTSEILVSIHCIANFRPTSWVFGKNIPEEYTHNCLHQLLYHSNPC